VELADTALTGPSLSAHAQTKQRSFPHRWLCCPPGSIGTTTASDALPARRPLPGSSPVIGHRLSRGDHAARIDRGGPPQFPPSPSARSTPSTPGSSSRLRSRLFTASMAFAPKDRARLSLSPPAGGHANDAADFASCCGPCSCSPTRAFDAALRRRAFPPDDGSLLPGSLATTRTGLTPAGDDELATESDQLMIPPSLWAHSRVSWNLRWRSPT
jgi:hypothetical protein